MEAMQKNAAPPANSHFQTRTNPKGAAAITRKSADAFAEISHPEGPKDLL
jgi:hypothetical protein